MDSAVLYAEYVALETAFNETIQHYPKLIPYVSNMKDKVWGVPYELSSKMWLVNKKMKTNPLFSMEKIDQIKTMEQTIILSDAENWPFNPFKETP